MALSALIMGHDSDGVVYGVRPRFRPSMRRDVSNPNRVVPDPHVWRSRRAGSGCWTTDQEVRYARTIMAEWCRRGWPVEGNVDLSRAARLLWMDLARITLEDRRKGRLDLTYRQLMVRLGVPVVMVDEGDGPCPVVDPRWGEGLRTLQRTVDELVTAGFVSKGFVANESGGHRLCLVLRAPEWFQALVAEVVAQGRAKGGRASRRTASVAQEQVRPRPPLVTRRGPVTRDVEGARRGLAAAREALANARAGP